MSGPATLDHLRQFVIASARKIGRGFTSPEDDWTQVAFMQNAEGIEIVALANDLFASGLSKNVLAAFLRRHVRAREVFRYVLLLNVHSASLTDEQTEAVEAERMRIEQIEGATEHLLLLVGDAEEEQVWMAPIDRKPKTAIRSMGKWERLDEKEGWSFRGRFAGLNEVMR